MTVINTLNAKYANAKKNTPQLDLSRRDWLIGLPLLVSFHFRSVGSGIDRGLKSHHSLSRNRNGKPMLINTIQPKSDRFILMRVNQTYLQCC
jgi:hypothetical protein